MYGNQKSKNIKSPIFALKNQGRTMIRPKSEPSLETKIIGIMISIPALIILGGVVVMTLYRVINFVVGG